MGDIQLSGAAALAVGGLLAVMSSAVTALWLALLASKNSQVAREQELTNTLLPSVREISLVVLRLAETIQAQGAESRERTERMERLLTDLREKILLITNRGRSA